MTKKSFLEDINENEDEYRVSGRPVGGRNFRELGGTAGIRKASNEEESSLPKRERKFTADFQELTTPTIENT